MSLSLDERLAFVYELAVAELDVRNRRGKRPRWAEIRPAQRRLLVRTVELMLASGTAKEDGLGQCEAYTAAFDSRGPRCENGARYATEDGYRICGVHLRHRPKFGFVEKEV